MQFWCANLIFLCVPESFLVACYENRYHHPPPPKSHQEKADPRVKYLHDGAKMDEDLPSVFTEENPIFRFFPSRGAIGASNAGQARGFFERGWRAKKKGFVK